MKISEIKKYKGQVELDINLDELRDRKNKRSSLKEAKKKALSIPEVEEEYSRLTPEYKRE